MGGEKITFFKHDRNEFRLTMKILHTADWHIGKILHKHSLADELALFFEWLIQTIDTEKIDLLLISGDIFDIANPSAADRKTYFGFLKKLVGKSLQIIITGGNHDSIGFLNAPSELLSELDISIIGGATPNIEDELIPIQDQNGDLKLVVAAVPFLRDKDLRNQESNDQYKNRTEALRAGMKKHYSDLAKICLEKYKNIPAIAMGHLYTVGADASDSEREIHLGNAVALDSEAFPKHFDYIALGHIHRPQIIGKNQFIRYSGSPIPLSFSEKEDKKQVLILELMDGKIHEPKSLAVPKTRSLKKISGDLTGVKEALKNFKPDFPLRSFVEIEVKEKDFSSVLISQVEDLKQAYSDHQNFTILKGKTIFEAGAKDTADLFKLGENIEDLKPKDVFEKRLLTEELDPEKEKMLLEAFQEILEKVQ